jgi:predicted MFS family arabinose efflux permease
MTGHTSQQRTAIVTGAARGIGAAVAKRLARDGPLVNLVCLLGVIASAAVLAFGSLGGALGLAALALGTLLLDVGVQSGMVANRVRIYALRPEVRSRLNTAYMTCAYLGGSMGSWGGARAYTSFGWLGMCGLVVLLAAVALTRHLEAVGSATGRLDAR